LYNLHTHSLLSDGVLLPSEIAVRYAAKGYKAIAITDHADYSNIESAVKAAVEFCRHWPANASIKVFPGVELTHLPCEQFKPLAKFARKAGCKVIIGHGQTIAEPVLTGTNRAALESDIDILAHPGLITESDARFAAEQGIFLEITSRASHGKTNRHVAKMARKTGASLVLNHDSHEPEDIITPSQLAAVGKASGLTSGDIRRIYKEVGGFIASLSKG
jgi:histidinol phosphatase-like PHP family hydrolase